MTRCMDTGENLLREIEAFCARAGLSETRFGVMAVGDGHLVRRLRDGKSLTVKRMDRVVSFMRDFRVAQPPDAHSEGKAA